MQYDKQGNILSTPNPKAAFLFSEAINDFLNYRTTPSARLKEALHIDPDFALATCFRACFLMMTESPAVLSKIQKTVQELQVGYKNLTEREILHIEALSAWANLDIIKACQIWENLIANAPRDILAIKLHHTMTFYTGRSQTLRSVIEGVLTSWNSEISNFSALQGMYAYALEECGEHQEAERWGREAVASNPDDLWAIHSVAHILDMQQRHAEGVIWLNYSAENWTDRNPFKAHLWWHTALFHIGLNDLECALSIHDELLLSVNTDTYVDVSNQASLLKRIEIGGMDVGDRWEMLSEYSEQRINDHMLAFRDLHFCLALAAGKKKKEAETQLRSMEKFALTDNNYTAAATKTVLIPLCKGIIEYEDGNYKKACEHLWKIRNDLAPIGGSHTQRDLFQQILEDAAIKGKCFGKAGNLLSERLSRHPQNPIYLAKKAKLADLSPTQNS
tara:strand:- start:687 stop:2027 length:1341 start_codon:yes stop_codon:yes gene_type:complete